MKKFRKVYIVVENKKIFGESDYHQVDVYRNKTHAEQVCKTRNNKAVEDAQLMWNVNKPIPVFTVHAYYLVHEMMF